MTEQMYRNHYAPLQLPAPGPHYSDPEYPDVDVAIIMESTYLYLKGGVSAVVHDIVCENPDLTYGIIHIAWDKNSPHEDLYGMPENVKWVKVLYLSLEVNRDAFAEACDPSALRMNFAQRQQLTQRLMDGFSALIAGDVNPLWKLYDEGINPATRSYNLFGLFGTREFMQAIAGLGFLSEVPFGELFWKVRDFVSILFALLRERMPHARVYHAHTTGYASLIAAAAARDHGTSFLLTEHNLYIRDTVNTRLERNMAKPVTTDYAFLNEEREHPGLGPVTLDERAWSVWFVELGRFCYPSADMATYLYPKALEEARGIGAPIDQMNEGEKDRAIILPNGMLIESVAEAYYARQTARARILAEGRGHVWRFVFIARVVPIKGLTDLIRSLAVLRDQGLVNFHLDVLGPKDHLPEYYELCLRTIEELNMGEYITFHGTMNVRAMLDRFDLLLMPSYNEGQPIVALEAMAASIPLVSTDVGGMSQLIDDVLVAPDGHEIGNCGILTIPGDIHGFAAALRILMEEPSIYERYCVNAYDRIVSLFQLRLVMDRYNTIYRELGKLPLAEEGDDSAYPAQRPQGSDYRHG